MWWHSLIVHLSQETGTSSSASRAYNFWSGFGSDIGEVAIVGGLIQIYRQHRCSVCHRIGVHKMEDIGKRTCHKHTTHQDHKDIRAAHRAKYPRHIAHVEPIPVTVVPAKRTPTKRAARPAAKAAKRT